nr:helix-turn-helix domain-containing protein [Desulfovibrio sp. UIB00]
MEAAEFLKVGRSTMLKLLTSGEVKAKKVGRQWRVTIAALNEYLEKADN